MSNKESLLNMLKAQSFPQKIIDAFKKVQREKFVPEESKSHSYKDIPIPLGFGQTISQPYTIAFMLMLLETEDNQKVLEVGSGSGYVLELLSTLNPNGRIFGVERIKELYENSKNLLKDIKNVEVVYGQGEKGLKEESPFDRIIVSAAADTIPQKLANQLKFGGIMVVPVRNSIVVVVKKSGRNEVKQYPGFRFVPLVEK